MYLVLPIFNYIKVASKSIGHCQIPIADKFLAVRCLVTGAACIAGRGLPQLTQAVLLSCTSTTTALELDSCDAPHDRVSVIACRSRRIAISH